MAHGIVQSSKPEIPWIPRHAINWSFTNFERDRKSNAITQSDERTHSNVANNSLSMHEEVAYTLTNVLPSPEPYLEPSPEPSTTESNRPKVGIPKHTTNEKNEHLEFDTNAFMNEAEV